MSHVAIGCDHRGFDLKKPIISFLQGSGHTCEDFGCYSTEPVDYPDIAQQVGKAVVSGRFRCGILICSTGIGMSIAANKIKGIRAALCHDSFTATRARQHNDANVLCLGAEYLNPESASKIVATFLATAFEGGRHSRRVDKITALERDS